jgi:hypothetical protein
MQIALPGSLHRVIVWLCTHSQLSTTVEAHDADRPAGLAASCHRIIVSLTMTRCAAACTQSQDSQHHSRGTRCSEPGRAICIVSSCGCALTHSYSPQSRHTMQIALPGSLHRVIVSLCSSVHSVTPIHHSRGTRCRSPCRARCIVSLCVVFQPSTTCVQSAPVCKSPASGAVT